MRENGLSLHKTDKRSGEGRNGRVCFGHGDFDGVEGAAVGVLVGVVVHADDGGVDAGIFDESEVGDAGEGVE